MPSIEVALKSQVDAEASARAAVDSSHDARLAAAEATLGGAVAAATANAVTRRDQSGNASFNEVMVAGQTTAGSAARRDYVDAQNAATKRIARTSTAAAAYTITAADFGTAIDFSTSNAVVTVPAAAASAIPAGYWVEIGQFSSATGVSIAPAAGVTVRAPDGNLTLRAVNSRVRLQYVGSDVWVLSGDTNDAVSQAAAAATATTAAVAAATSAATANTIAKRDGSGRLRVADPAAAADAATLGWTTGLLTGDDRFAAPARAPQALGNKLTKVGIVLGLGAAGALDDAIAESLFPFIDPESGRIAGVYTGYRNNAGVMVGSVGLAYSDDGVTWTKAGQLMAGSGTVGAADRYGCTGPVIVYDAGLYYLFRISLDAAGYEAGTKRIMLSSTPSLKNPVWTHYGVVMAPGGTGWRGGHLWHTNFVRSGGLWYCFLNASGADGKERIGYATAPALTGPWTFDDVNSPLLTSSTAAVGDICGDPFVRKTPGGWRMDYFTSDSVGAYDWYTTTTDAAFPLGWRAHDPADLTRRTVAPGPAGSIDALYAHKPILLVKEGRVYHYYTAVMAGNANRRVALAVDPPLPPVAGRVARLSSTGTVGITVGTSYVAVTDPGDLTLAARVGEWIRVTVGLVADNGTGDLRTDVATVVSGAIVTYLSGVGAAGNGVGGWTVIGGRYDNLSGSVLYQVKEADRDAAGNVTLRLLNKVTAGSRIILRNANDVIMFQAEVIG